MEEQGQLENTWSLSCPYPSLQCAPSSLLGYERNGSKQYKTLGKIEPPKRKDVSVFVNETDGRELILDSLHPNMIDP